MKVRKQQRGVKWRNSVLKSRERKKKKGHAHVYAYKHSCMLLPSTGQTYLLTTHENVIHIAITFHFSNQGNLATSIYFSQIS